MSFAGCNTQKSNSPAKEDNSTNTSTQNTSSTLSGNDGELSSNNDKLLGSFYRVPGKNIYVNVPSCANYLSENQDIHSEYVELEGGFTRLFMKKGERYVTVTADVNTKVTSLQEAHDVAFKCFKEAIQNYSYVNTLNIAKKSTETINGIEVYKYEGTLNCSLSYNDTNKTYEAYVIGYSFIMDGVPCTITGSVINQSQDEKQITEIRDIIEAMIKTVRNKK